jgi:hypothetical protein
MNKKNFISMNSNNVLNLFNICNIYIIWNVIRIQKMNFKNFLNIIEGDTYLLFNNLLIYLGLEDKIKILDLNCKGFLI